MSIRWLLPCGIALLVGCGGPTHTVGTEGISDKKLAILSVAQLPKEAPVRIHSIQFDDASDAFKIGGSRDFYLTPGSHTASFTLIATVPGPAGIFIPGGALTIRGPQRIPLGNVAAGKAYELAPTIGAFENTASGGGFTLVREKAK